MAEDHLDKEVSISGKLTPTGVEARSRSRFVAAVDRLLGNVVDRLNAPIEAKTNEIRAKASARITLIEAMSAMGVDHLKTKPERLIRTIENDVAASIRRLENKEAVVEAAIEDLRRQPPSQDQSQNGPEVLEADFVNRFERHAEDATSESVREKWGRVLASEVRRPGTFTVKALRLVDEIDADTAIFFEKLCKNRIGDAVPRCLHGNLNFNEVSKLVDAGLIFDPQAGQVRLSFKSADQEGANAHIIAFENGAIAIVGDKIEVGKKFSFDMDVPLVSKDGAPNLPIILLTDAGESIASILDDGQADAFRRLVQKVADYATEYKVQELVKGSAGYNIVRTVAPQVSQAPG